MSPRSRAICPSFRVFSSRGASPPTSPSVRNCLTDYAIAAPGGSRTEIGEPDKSKKSICRQDADKSTSLIYRHRLGDQLLDHVAVDVREAEVAARVAVGELLVVEAHQLEDRRLEIVDVDALLHRLEAELVGRAVDVAALRAAARQPRRIA